MKRVETGIAEGYWPEWTMVNALKEFIANAKDSDGNVALSWSDGEMIIMDDGPGFDKACLQLGHGETKGAGKIGQFKEGMKGAMLVCRRNDRGVKIQTPHLTVTAEIEETELGPNGFVLYYDDSEACDVGTIVTVDATEVEARKVYDQFAGITIDGIEVEKTDDDRLMSIPERGKGKVYVNSALATEGDFLFNWNFSADALKQMGLKGAVRTLKAAQNRDREVVGMDRIEQVMAEVLCTMKDEGLIRHYLTSWEDGKRGRREYSSSLVRGTRMSLDSMTEQVWRPIVRDVFGEKRCRNPQGHYGDRRRRQASWMSDDSEFEELGHHYGPSEHEILLSVQEMGYEPLPSNIPEPVAFLIGCFFPLPSDVLDEEASKPEEKVVQAISKWDWTDEQDAVINEAVDAYCKIFGEDPDDFPTVRMFERCYTKPQAEGLWYKGYVWLRRDIVDAASCSREQFESLCGTVAHEVAHKQSRTDRTREFENELTRMVGLAVAAQTRGKRERAASKGEIRGWSEDYPEKLTYAEIFERFEAIDTLEPSSKRTAFLLREEEVPEWSYAGMVIESRKTRRDKLLFVFTSRRTTGQEIPATMVVKLMPDNTTRLKACDGERAVRYFGNTTRDGRDLIRDRDFGDIDLRNPEGVLEDLAANQ